MSKNIAFNVDYSRSNLASTITWTDPKNKIENCEAFIDYIRCDDGDQYQFLHTDKGEIINHSLFMFEAVSVKGKKDQYLLCYSADFEIADYSNHTQFLKALKHSKNQIEIVLCFKDSAGNILDDCFEETDNRTAKLSKS
jgi:hypothetical protein